MTLLAVLESGAAYLPLDPAYPAERLRFLLADTGAALVVAGRSLAWPEGFTAENPALSTSTRRLQGRRRRLFPRLFPAERQKKTWRT